MMLTGLLLTSHANALFNIPQLSTPNLNQLVLEDKTLAKTGLKENKDDVLPEQEKSNFKLSEEQLHEAKVWGLTESEEKRYIHLMQNKSAVYYKGLDLTPVDILGINARNESERNHFAKLGAKQEALKVTKNIAWNNAFYRAYNELFKDVPVIDEGFDPKPYGPMAYDPIPLMAGDNLYWFIETKQSVKTVLLILLKSLNLSLNTRLNILFLNAQEMDIQGWANLHQIPPELVKTGQITLNHGEMHFESLTLPKKQSPLLLLVREGKTHVVDLGKI